MDVIRENWSKIKENIKKEYSISDISYHTWIEPMEVQDVVNDVIQVGAPTNQVHVLNFISAKYRSFLQAAIMEMFKHPYTVEIVPAKEAPQITNMAEAHPVPKEKAPVGLGEFDCLNPKYTFENFITGTHCELALAAAQAVAKLPAKTYNPVYLYGSSGLGKTHLLHAIGNCILERDPNMKILYVTGELFIDEIIDTVRNGSVSSMVKLRERYQEVDVLIVDDIQVIAGKESTQEELLRIFGALQEANKQIIVAADRSPNKIENLDERFRTCFEWGLIADIQQPDYETRMAILRRNAKEIGLSIDETVLDYIATNMTASIRELEGAFNKIVAVSRLNRVDITLEMTKEALKYAIRTDEPEEMDETEDEYEYEEDTDTQTPVPSVVINIYIN